jgi:hypothetical protein
MKKAEIYRLGLMLRERPNGIARMQPRGAPYEVAVPS